jgi:hypothetical protein
MKNAVPISLLELALIENSNATETIHKPKSWLNWQVIWDTIVSAGRAS